MQSSLILPLPRPSFWYQGVSYLLQHLTGVDTTSLPHEIIFHNKITDDANFARATHEDREGVQ